MGGHLSYKTSISMALALSGTSTSHTSTSLNMPPRIPSRPGSIRSSPSNMYNKNSSSTPNLSLYTGASNRPRGWKQRRPRMGVLAPVACNVHIKKWQGAARNSVEWDGLRKDPDLWQLDGDCLVYLYGKGQSRRGPAFKLSFDEIVDAGCYPLLRRFLDQNKDESPICETSDFEESISRAGCYEMYIPAPASAGRAQSMLYHIATRNFFAWIFGQSLVGPRLSDAIIGLLHSMNEFRSENMENVEDILDYMDNEGYADMRCHPTHALAILNFAEHFHFRDLYIDAFSHCVGMIEDLSDNLDYEATSAASRELICQNRTEMDGRINRAGRSLSTFLEEELSNSRIGLPSAERVHLDQFRSFLHAYYVAKLGYYPPQMADDRTAAFPKEIYALMHIDFQMLYEFLVDETFSSPATLPSSAQGGLCAMQSVHAFDFQHRYESLPYPLPLIPASTAEIASRKLTTRLAWSTKSHKLKPDELPMAVSALAKATNRHRLELLNNSLVTAFVGFERQNVLSIFKSNKSSQISAADARKVHWILIYAMLQTLRSVTEIPGEVRDTQDVGYNLCVTTQGCPPWKDERPFTLLLRTQTDHTAGNHANVLDTSEAIRLPELRPDIEYIKPRQFSSATLSRQTSATSPATLTSTLVSQKGTVRRALLTLGKMPELKHPRPQRNSFHEILIQGYGNGLKPVPMDNPPPAVVDLSGYDKREHAGESDSSLPALSSSWSPSSDDDTLPSPASSLSSPRASLETPTEGIGETDLPPLSRVAETRSADMRPAPLKLKQDTCNGSNSEELLLATEDFRVQHTSNPELDAYLNA